MYACWCATCKPKFSAATVELLRATVRDALRTAVDVLATSAALSIVPGTERAAEIAMPLAKLLPHTARAADAVLVGTAAHAVGAQLHSSVPLRTLSFSIFASADDQAQNEPR
jgi:hypothetical protein